MKRLGGKVAIVTGASRGIGRSIALRCGREGAKVVVGFLKSREEAEEVVRQIEEAGSAAIAVSADVTSEDAVRRMVAAAVSTFGQVDILIANAGIVEDQLAAAMTWQQWESVIRTNLGGPFICIRETLPHMMRRKSGCIVCISSIAAELAGRGHCNYAAAKGGLNAMTRSLAVEVAPKGIRVNAVAPGVVVTDMTRRIRGVAGDAILSSIPLRRFGQPEDVANTVCFLASDEASYVTGEIVHVTGGLGL